MIVLFVSIFGTALAVVNAYLTARNKNRFSHLIHFMSIISLAIPGIVLGLSYVIFHDLWNDSNIIFMERFLR